MVIILLNYSTPDNYISIIVGCLLGGASSLANAILGVYSLSEIKITKSTHIYNIAALSTLGAIPTDSSAIMVILKYYSQHQYSSKPDCIYCKCRH